MNRTVITVLLSFITLPYSLWAYDFVMEGVYYSIIDKRSRTVEVTHWEEATANTGTPLRVVHHVCGPECHHDHQHEHLSRQQRQLIQMDKDAVERERTAYIGVVTIPERVRYKGRTYTVIGIGDGSFYMRKQLTEVRLPSSITYIGRCAFSNCSALRYIQLPPAVQHIGMAAFRRCMSFTSVTLPDSLSSIGIYAFAFCERLESINIPERVDTFPGNMVFHCVQMKSITLQHTIPPVVDNSNGLKMDFKNMVFKVREEALPTYRNDTYWSKMQVRSFD